MSALPGTAFERFVFPAERTKDGKPHDEIGTIGRARATLARARNAKSPPDWFDGALEDYRRAVESAIFTEYEGVEASAATSSLLSGGDYFVTSQVAFERTSGRNRYRKDILSIGTLIHPTSGDTHEFTQERLTALAVNSNAMIGKGREVYFPMGHTRDAGKNLGKWDSFSVEGGKLFGVCTVKDPEARRCIENGTLNRVSAFIKGPWTESDGSLFSEVIEHVAATPIPVHINQDDFEPVALALDAQGISVYVEDRPVVEPAKPKQSDVKLEASPEFLQALGLSVDATPEQVILATKKLKEDAAKAVGLEAKHATLEAAHADLAKQFAAEQSAKLDAEIDAAMKSGRGVNKQTAPLFRALIERKESIALSADGKSETKSVGEIVREIIKLSTVDSKLALEGAVVLPPVGDQDKAKAELKNRREWAAAYEQRTSKKAVWLDAQGNVVPKESDKAFDWKPAETAKNGTLTT